MRLRAQARRRRRDGEAGLHTGRVHGPYKSLFTTGVIETGCLVAQRAKLTDGTATAKAIDYGLKRWEALVRYLDDPAPPIDNHDEQQIRPRQPDERTGASPARS